MKRTEQEILEAIDAAHERANQQRLRREEYRTSLDRILQAIPGLKFIHLRGYLGEKKTFGGATLAYKLPEEGNNIIYVSVALCRTTDRYDNLLGRYYAATSYSSDAVIPVRLTRGMSVQEVHSFLEARFSFLA